jgi:type IV secretory pathway TrbD component
MRNEPRFRPVYKSINKPLTIWGVERRLFFLAVIMGGATFNFFASLLSGVVMFAALWVFGRWATGTDPQVLRIVLNSSRFRAQYDPTRWQQWTVVIGRRPHDSGQPDR